MLSPRTVAAVAVIAVAAGCGPTQPNTQPFIAPTGVPAPTATPAGATPTPTPTATPVGATPTPTPTATPAPASLVPSPTSLTFTGLGASNAANLSVVEAGYGGAFTEKDTCAGIATVTTASPSFTVTPAAAGTCTITVADASQHTVGVPVSVTTSGLVVQKKGVHR